MDFVAYERTLQGTGASRRLRIAGKVPGIVYGGGNATMIELDHNALFHALKKEAFHSSILKMEMAGKAEQVLLRDYQMHPYRPLVLHIDFQRVDATTKITKKVPLHFINEENSPAVKTDKCLISHVVSDITVQCPGFATARVHHRRSRRAVQGPELAPQRPEARRRHEAHRPRQAEPRDRHGAGAGR